MKSLICRIKGHDISDKNLVISIRYDEMGKMIENPKYFYVCKRCGKDTVDE